MVDARRTLYQHPPISISSFSSRASLSVALCLQLKYDRGGRMLGEGEVVMYKQSEALDMVRNHNGAPITGGGTITVRRNIISLCGLADRTWNVTRHGHEKPAPPPFSVLFLR
jgi:hypothetical protein